MVKHLFDDGNLHAGLARGCFLVILGAVQHTYNRSEHSTLCRKDLQRTIPIFRHQSMS
jgi:hypothetical protein